MIYDTTKLQDSKVVKEIQVALSGIGKLPVNRKIRKRTWELEKVFGYSKVELCNMIYTYIRNNNKIGWWANLNRINNRYSSISTYITWITYYKLCEYLKILCRDRDFIHLDCEYESPKEEITGEPSRSIIEEKYTDGISTEDIVIKKNY